MSLLYSIDQAATLDLDAVTEKSMENPVFYVQYAHARIAALERQAIAKGVERSPVDEVDLGLLVHPRELELLRSLVDLPRDRGGGSRPGSVQGDELGTPARRPISTASTTTAAVMGEGIEPALTQARLWLVEAARVGLTIGLDLLGVTAPDQM